jgi:hypothetical protein
LYHGRRNESTPGACRRRGYVLDSLASWGDSRSPNLPEASSSRRDRLDTATSTAVPMGLALCSWLPGNRDSTRRLPWGTGQTNTAGHLSSGRPVPCACAAQDTAAEAQSAGPAAPKAAPSGPAQGRMDQWPSGRAAQAPQAGGPGAHPYSQNTVVMPSSRTYCRQSHPRATSGPLPLGSPIPQP